ncbi:MAG: DUF2723 domain-containing protein [Longimicrobiales bacterium]
MSDTTRDTPTAEGRRDDSGNASRGSGGDGESPPYLWGVAAAGAVFLLYVVTLAPTTQFWDTSEYIATGHILGIPHPPGNPLFVVLARAWDILLTPLGLSTAVEINLFSATMGAMAHGLWFMVVHRILGHFSDHHWFRIGGAFAAVLVSATAFTVWNQSNVNEKVYTVSLFTIVLLTWLAFRWREHLGEGKDDNILVLMVFILALSVGNHLMAFLAAPALAVFILWLHPQSLLNYRLYVAGVAAVLLGLSIHLYLPLRAALDPVINEADPTCRSLGGALTSIVTWGQAGCAELSAALAREQYDKPPLLPRLAPLHDQLGHYLQYFNWQWARSLNGTDVLLGPLRVPFTFLFTGLGIFGAWEHYRRDKVSWAYIFVLFGTLSAALVFYLNFRYGYSYPAPSDVGLEGREVRERDYFFIASFSVWGIWAGMGVAALWQKLGGGTRTGLLRSAPVLGVALLPLMLNWSWASRAEDYSARDWAYNLLQSVEPYGVLFTNGDNDTFPLWYLQEVEGIRKDVTVIVVSYLNTEWYVRQLRGLTEPCEPDEDPLEDPTRIICQRPYDPGETEPLYTAEAGEGGEVRGSTTEAGDEDGTGRVRLIVDRPVRPPTRGIIPLDSATITEVAGSYVPLDQAQAYQVGNIRAQLSAGSVLYPWHQFALVVIDSALGDRPVYFASSGNAAESLGLSSNLVREGVAFKLYDDSLDEETAPSGFVSMEETALQSVTGPWLHVPRTRTLVDDVFIHRSGLPRAWTHWPDHSTVGIPNYYAWANYSLAQAALMQGDSTTLRSRQERAEAWMELGE